jgi:hypothetical protein
MKTKVEKRRKRKTKVEKERKYKILRNIVHNR